MQTLALVLATLLALLHVYILVLEMFFWTKPLGRKAFGLKADFAEQSKALAANQGLYNGFLAAGLAWAAPAQAQEAWSHLVAAMNGAGAKPVIDRIFPMDQVQEAFARLSGGHLGKVLVEVNKE